MHKKANLIQILIRKEQINTLMLGKNIYNSYDTPSWEI